MATIGYEVFDHMIEGVQIIDPDMRYVYVNEAVAQHGKSSREALVGTTMSESYPGIERTELYRLIRECLDEQRSQQLVNEFDFPDGSKGYFQLRMQPIPEGVLILSFDVTDQRRAEQAMADLNTALEERVEERTALLRARNEELAQIAYIASHDLQEPLRTIRSHVELLAEDLGPRLDDDSRTSLGFVTSAAKRMQSLIAALLDFSRLDRPAERERTDLDALVGSVIGDLAGLVERTGATIEVEPLPTLDVFPAELRLLFQNLLSNAVKFRAPERPPEVKVGARREAGAWRFTVTDNGIGFDPRFRDKVFMIFQRLHARSEYEGTGIGLAHCKKIVALHGGEIGCESTPGEGSTFHFTLPGTAGEAPEAAPARRRRLRRALLIDDNPADNYLHARVLRRADCVEEIQSCETVLEALEYLRTKEGDAFPQPELIVLDIYMPGMSGWDFLEAHEALPAEQRGNTVIAMVTGAPSPADATAAARYEGVVDYSEKPLTTDRLSELQEKHFPGVARGR